MSKRELDELIELIDEVSGDLARIPLLESAVHLADTLGDRRTAYHLRKDLIYSTVFNGQMLKALPAFSWCLGEAQRNDSDFDTSDILWEYKWICSHVADFYEISLQKIEELDKDFLRLLKENGCSEYTYHYIVMNQAISLNNKELAKSSYKEMLKFSRDYMSDCRACVQDGLVQHAIFIGDYPLALKLAEPILKNKMSCAEVPHFTFSELLFPAFFNDDLQNAEIFAKRGYPIVCRNPVYLGVIGNYLIYDVFTASPRVLTKYSRLVKWSFSPYCLRTDLFYFNGACAVMFKKLLSNGKKNLKLNIPQEHPLYNSENHYETEAFIEYHRKQAADMAEKLDKRNGNSGFAESLQELLALTA
jgi:hypothetical protein